MQHKDKFRYVEFCRGLSGRNHLIPVTEIGRAIQSSLRDNPETELYRSVPLYSEEAMDWVSEKGTLAGYSGETWADHVYIDIDHDDDLGIALDSAQRIVGRLLTTFFVDHKALKIAFSGKKGFHIYIPQGLIGFPPHALLHKQMALFVAEVAGANLYDKVIYTPGRIIRVAYSRHAKSGLYKYLMTAQDLISGTVAGILETAKAPPAPPTYDMDVEVNEGLAAAWPRPERLERTKPAPRANVALPVMGEAAMVEIRTDQRMCMQRIMNDRVPEGEGNERGIRLASHFANLGTPVEIVAGIMQGWNQKMENPMDDARLMNTLVKPAIEHKYYYGCSDTVLASLCDKRCFKYTEEVATQKVDPGKFKTIFDLSKEYLRTYTEKRFVTFGVTELDVHCRGFAPGEVAILVAKSGVGKTTFMMNMARQIARSTKLPILILEQELHDFLMTEKMVTMSADITGPQLEQTVLRGIDQGDLRDFDALLEKTDEVFKNVFVCTDDRLDTDTKINLIKAFTEKYGRPAVVFEDFLGRGQEAGRTPYEIASKLARGLKTVAKACDVPYLCLAQVSRGNNPADDSSMPLTMSSARDSGQIEENADFIFGMSRPNFGGLNADNVVRVQILKNRRGHGDRDFSLLWDREHGNYTSIEKSITADMVYRADLAAGKIDHKNKIFAMSEEGVDGD